MNSSQIDGNKADDKEECDIEVHYVYNAALSSNPGEPKSIAEALQGNDRLKWIEAIKKEIENIVKRKT